jgi:hypothetical protein
MITEGGEIQIRRPRSDRGSIRPKPRDIYALSWICEQYTVRGDQLQRLLGRTIVDGRIEEHELSLRTVDDVVLRWKKAGFAEAKRFMLREPYWVWPKHKAITFVEQPYRYYEPNITTLRHMYAVNQVRLFVEARKASQGQSIVWRSERALRREAGREENIHFVDAEVTIDGSVVAIEVELTQKKASRVTTVLDKLAGQYDTIWYFTDKKTQPAITKAIASLSDDVSGKFRIYSLDDL